jgi:UDP-N-acetylglucosamine 4-epimerase
MYNHLLYKNKYHDVDLANYSFLITGGAGFIGSNLVEYLLRNGAGHVRVLDNLSNGYYENIQGFKALPNFQFIDGDICDYKTCQKAIEDIDFVSHQAALGSVPRSIKDPITTNLVNVNGFLNILNVVKESPKVKKMVYAASSSTYGDSKDLPKVEGNEGKPLSPYAVTKLINELYAEVFFKVYNLETIGLRYFNVFGPKQNPNNPYAAVIPIFAKAFIENKSPQINGDGETSRDFTFVENVIQANIKALLSKNTNSHRVYNVACGDRFSLNQMIESLRVISKKDIKPTYTNERIGDVKHSMASIDRIVNELNYNPNIRFEEGLKIVYDWYLNNFKIK